MFPFAEIQSLPPNCTYEGKAEVDVGTCRGNACRTYENSDEGTCFDSIDNTCMIAEFDTVDIKCTPVGTVPLQIAKTCGCRANYKN